MLERFVGNARVGGPLEYLIEFLVEDVVIDHTLPTCELEALYIHLVPSKACLNGRWSLTRLMKHQH